MGTAGAVLMKYVRKDKRPKTSSQIREERKSFMTDIQDVLIRHQVGVHRNHFIGPACPVSGFEWHVHIDEVERFER